MTWIYPRYSSLFWYSYLLLLMTSLRRLLQAVQRSVVEGIGGRKDWFGIRPPGFLWAARWYGSVSVADHVASWGCSLLQLLLADHLRFLHTVLVLGLLAKWLIAAKNSNQLNLYSWILLKLWWELATALASQSGNKTHTVQQKDCITCLR